MRKDSRKYYLFIFIIFFSFITLFASTTLASPAKKNVLVIQSYNSGYKWTDDIMSGLNSILNTTALDLNVQVEYMDTLRNSGAEYDNKLLEFYKYKYKDSKLDAVICCDDNAYNFVLQNQKQIFPNTPIIFCGVNYFDAARITGNTMVTGIIENYDLGANLDLIMKQHPKTENVYIVNDKTVTGEAINKKLTEVIASRKDGLNYINLQGESINEITNTLKNPKPNSAILFLIFFDDSHGNHFNYDESPKLISGNSSIPIYGAWEFSLGHGIIGGMLTSGFFQGKTAAEITLKVLNGSKPSDIPIVDKNTNSYMFDYDQMKRFGLTASDLPPDSYIVNRASNAKKQILVLNSYHYGMKWTNDIITGIKSVFNEQDYDLYFDYMDARRNYTDEYKVKIEDLLKYKFKNKHFDVIITADNDAYDFMERYHDKLFPVTPLVFSGLNYYSPTDLKDLRTTGVIETLDVKKTLDLALIQNPNTKHVVIINDLTLTGKANKELLNSVLPEFKDKVDFTFYENMNMTDVQDGVSKLGKDTIVYLLTFNNDKSNNIFSYEESTELITTKSSVPVYGAWDFCLGHGIIGGLLTSGESQGAMAAELAKQVLKGVNPKDIPISTENANKYMFDYNALKKFNINTNSLPEGSIIINQPQGFHLQTWQKTVLVFLMLLLILVLFIINKRNNSKIEANIETIKELEHTAATIDFLTKTLNRAAGVEELNKEIVHCLKNSCRFIICFIDLAQLKSSVDSAILDSSRRGCKIP